MKIFAAKKIDKSFDAYIFLMEGQNFSENFEIDKNEKKIIENSIKKSNFQGKEGEFKVQFNEKLKTNIFLIGLGRRENLTFENFKTILNTSISKSSKNFFIFFNPEILRIEKTNSFSSALINLATIDYKYQDFLKEKIEEKEAYVFKPNDMSGTEFNALLKKTEAIKKGIYLSRDIGNAPASSMPPKKFLEIVKKLGKEFGWKVNCLNENKLKSLKLPGIVAVGKSSENPPILIEIRCSEKVDKILIGKGVIFDSGGLSLKTQDGMENMKYDKCGASVVLGTLVALSILKRNEGLGAHIPLVENLVSGTGYKPGDILVYPNGETVEIISTDAEGRLILADAIYLASQKNPSYIITIATLTGAMKYSLGPYGAFLIYKG